MSPGILARRLGPRAGRSRLGFMTGPPGDGTAAAGEALAAALSPLSEPEPGELVVAPPENEPGWWAGAPCAVTANDAIWLAYRLRRPVGAGRGYANVVARSTDGLTFETVAVVEKDTFGADSLERPALVPTPAGGWRLFVSCATPGTAHWRVDLLEAPTVHDLSRAEPRTVLPGSSNRAVKDPVILRHDGQWHLWASIHPLDDPDATDRMWTEHATSADGISWDWHGPVLSGRAGHWDARGVRISAVLVDGGTPLATYDGRASADENYEERTGVAVGGRSGDVGGAFHAVGIDPAATSPHGGGGLRYLSFITMPDGARRCYFESTRPDGAHELRTVLLEVPAHAARAAQASS
jgi:hypothetical protein